MYDNALRLFNQFTILQGHQRSWPPTVNLVIDFVAFLSLQGYASSSIKSYISAISFQCKINNQEDVTQNFVVKKLLVGIGRIDKRKDVRMPITLNILNKVVQALPIVCSSIFEATLFAALFTIAFFGFLRVGELVVYSVTNLGHAISRSNLKYISDPRMLEIKLCYSKTDQTGLGSVICLPSTGTSPCPVQAYCAYDSIRPNYPGIYFRHSSGKPVTRYQFVSVLKKCLDRIGVDSKYYKSHSFRIGAATSCSLVGISDEEIAKCGRWTSNAYKTYIRIPTQSMTK